MILDERNTSYVNSNGNELDNIIETKKLYLSLKTLPNALKLSFEIFT